jgi:hypothetical protein
MSVDRSFNSPAKRDDRDPFGSPQSTRARSRSEPDVTDIDRHEHRFGHSLVVGAARINAPTVGHHDPADLLIVVDIVSARGAAEHVL